MRRWKIMILGLLTVVTVAVGPVALVVPEAAGAACNGGGPHDPVRRFIGFHAGMQVLPCHPIV